MSDTPAKIRFVRSMNPKDEMLRDKDNAKPKAPSPSWSNQPRLNLAPPGIGGIKRGLAMPAKSQQPARPRFALGEPNKLKGSFKPIAAPNKDRDRGR
ncbi:hypothetical protein ACX9MO_17335 [Pseudooceanicola sp. 502str34]